MVRAGTFVQFLLGTLSTSVDSLRLHRPTPPPGHPYNTVPWVAGRGRGPVPKGQDGGPDPGQQNL